MTIPGLEAMAAPSLLASANSRGKTKVLSFHFSFSPLFQSAGSTDIQPALVNGGLTSNRRFASTSPSRGGKLSGKKNTRPDSGQITSYPATQSSGGILITGRPANGLCTDPGRFVNIPVRRTSSMSDGRRKTLSVLGHTISAEGTQSAGGTSTSTPGGKGERTAQALPLTSAPTNNGKGLGIMHENPVSGQATFAPDCHSIGGTSTSSCGL